MKRLTWAWPALAAAAASTVAVGAAAAPAHRSARPKPTGATKSGKQLFQTTCGVCHTLKAAGSVGNTGPDLNKVTLSEALIVRAITNGGATVMSRSLVAKYTTQMTAYQNALTPAQIQEIAAFVYSSTHAK